MESKKFLALFAFALLLAGCVSQAQQENPLPTLQPTQTAVASPTKTIAASTPTIQPTQEFQPTTQPYLNPHRNSPETPSDAEREKLPECGQLKFTEFPVDMNQVYEINPLGNLAPPGHTIPTEHSYLHLNAGGSTQELHELHSPASVFITSISGGPGLTRDPFDYTIYFSLCKNVVGYYNHVKQLSPRMLEAKKTGNCNKNQGSEYEYCEIPLEKFSAGETMGKVGGLQGNFDFGLMDFSKPHVFANPARYGARTPYINCPYEHYEKEKKEKFFSLIKRDDEGQCGFVAQDVAGTLQGNWFYGDARTDSPTGWDASLSFAIDDADPSTQVVSAGGKFTEAGVWEFTPTNAGNINRNFSQATPKNAYCYQSAQRKEKVIVEIVNETSLRIEKQQGECSGTETLQNPIEYNR